MDRGVRKNYSEPARPITDTHARSPADGTGICNQKSKYFCLAHMLLSPALLTHAGKPPLLSRREDTGLEDWRYRLRQIREERYRQARPQPVAHCRGQKGYRGMWCVCSPLYQLPRQRTWADYSCRGRRAREISKRPNPHYAGVRHLVSRLRALRISHLGCSGPPGPHAVQEYPHPRYGQCRCQDAT